FSLGVQQDTANSNANLSTRDFGPSACGFLGRQTSTAGICYPARKMPHPRDQVFPHYFLYAIYAVLLSLPGSAALTEAAPQQAAAPAKPSGAPPAAANVDFAAAADEVLGQMSEITGLTLRTPLKKSRRTREQTRAFVIKEMDEDKDAAERYAGQRSAEAFGLLPKGFDLDSFMVALLTEQIAGLYDPKAHEFY